MDQNVTTTEDPKALERAERAEAIAMIKELRENRCRCGSEKKLGFSFCYDCFKSLPPVYQKELYKKMGSGYEEAYRAAVKYLDIQSGRVK